MKIKDSLLSSPQLADNDQGALALNSKQTHSLYKKSKSSGIPMETLEQVYYRGVASGDSSTGFARVDSFIHGGEAARIDADLAEGLKALAKQIVKDLAHTAFPGYKKTKHKVHKAKNHKYIKKLRENVVVQGEPISDDPAEPSSRFAGTDKLTQVFKSQTPGQEESETRADVVKRVVRDQINKNKKGPA
jgi:hypothetical protein